eukprot:4302131-Pyramimonas_sp.AAC.1
MPSFHQRTRRCCSELSPVVLIPFWSRYTTVVYSPLSPRRAATHDHSRRPRDSSPGLFSDLPRTARGSGGRFVEMLVSSQLSLGVQKPSVPPFRGGDRPTTTAWGVDLLGPWQA